MQCIEPGFSKALKYFSLCLLFFLIPKNLEAAEKKWNVSLFTGVYKPSLKTLNQVLQTPKTAILQDPNHQLSPNNAFGSEVRNLKISPYEVNKTFGIEIKRWIAPKHALTARLNVWDSTVNGADIIPQITAANATEFTDVPRSTRYNLSITQLWLGWQYTLFSPFPKNEVYLDMGFIGAAFGQMTVDNLLKVTGPGTEGFPIVSSMESRGWGMTSRWGLGSHYAIFDWLAVTFRIAYVIGEIPKMKINRFFPSGFSTPPPEETNTELEPRPEVGDSVNIAEVQSETSTREVRTNIRPLPLELDGLEVLFGFQITF